MMKLKGAYAAVAPFRLRDESRPALAGVCCSHYAGRPAFVTTDGHRMAIARLEAAPEGWPVSTELWLYLDAPGAGADLETWIQTSVASGGYPDWLAVLPGETSASVRVKRRSLLDATAGALAAAKRLEKFDELVLAVERAKLKKAGAELEVRRLELDLHCHTQPSSWDARENTLEWKNLQAQINKVKGSVEALREPADRGLVLGLSGAALALHLAGPSDYAYHAEVAANAWGGQAALVGLNPRYLHEAVKASRGETLTIYWPSDGLAPIRFDGDDTIQVIMPMRLG